MIRHQVARGLRAAGTTAVALALGATLAPAAQASTTTTPDDPAQDPPPAVEEAPGDQGISVRVATATDVRTVRTTRAWAPHLLADEGVAVDRDDLVRVLRAGRRTSGRERRLQGGDTVVRVAVERTRSHTDRRIARRVTTRTVMRLRPGQRTVVRRGHPGLRRTTVVRTRHDGLLVGTRRSTRVVRTPVARRVLVGHRFGSVPGADRLDWRALAGCESTNNPRAVNPAGYYGLYQFNRATWAGVGGSGLPSKASRAEQTYRAKRLYQARGRSPWPHCGRLL